MRTLCLPLILLLLFSFSHSILAQDSIPKYGVDSVKCLKNLTLFNSIYKEKKYDEALPYWRLVFTDCPAANKVIYSGGEKIFKQLINKEKDQGSKEKYIDTLLSIYDQRMRFFGNDEKYPTSWIKGQKGKSLYIYKKDIDGGYELLTESVNELNLNTPANFLLYLIEINTVKLKAKTLSTQAAFDNYFQVHQIIEANLKGTPGEKEEAKLISAEKKIDDLFAKWEVGDCEILSQYLEKKLDEDNTDVFILKSIIRILQTKKCTDSPIFYKTIETLAEVDPNAIDPLKLGDLYYKLKSYQKALAYYKKALSLYTEDNEKLADIYLKMATITGINLGQPAKGRTLANKAIENNPNWGLPYILIAKLYAGATTSINKNSELKNTALWAAVDKLIKAKTIDPAVSEIVNPDIADYSTRFPLLSDAHFCGIKKGDTYTVGGWINETTTARFLD